MKASEDSLGIEVYNFRTLHQQSKHSELMSRIFSPQCIDYSTILSSLETNHFWLSEINNFLKYHGSF